MKVDYFRVPKRVRWALVIPCAIVPWLITLFVCHALLIYDNPDSIIKVIVRIIAPFSGPLLFLKVGYDVAPDHKWATAIGLLILAVVIAII